MIPQRLERQTYSYQKYTLPIKLRNLYVIKQLKDIIKISTIKYLYILFDRLYVRLLNKTCNNLFFCLIIARALRFELKTRSLKLLILPLNYTLYINLVYKTRKRDELNI